MRNFTVPLNHYASFNLALQIFREKHSLPSEEGSVLSPSLSLVLYLSLSLSFSITQRQKETERGKRLNILIYKYSFFRFCAEHSVQQLGSFPGPWKTHRCHASLSVVILYRLLYHYPKTMHILPHCLPIVNLIIVLYFP